MSLVESILSQPGHLQRIDQVVRQLPGVRRHRGWVLVDAANFDDHAWIHSRPYLLDETEGLPGFRRERRDGDGLSGYEILSWLEPRSGYALALAKGPEEKGLSQAVRELLQRVQDIRLPFLMVDAAGEPLHLWYHDGEGHRRPLPPVGALRREALRLSFRGRQSLEGEWLLPLTLFAASPRARARVEIHLPERSGFQRSRYVFVIENSLGQALGSGRIQLDVRPEPEGKDELVLRAEGFSEPPRILTFDTFEETGRQPASDERWRIHLLFDRTTLDVDAWPAALAASTGDSGGQGVDESRNVRLTTKPSAPVSSLTDTAQWNLVLRRKLAEALQGLEGEMPGVELDLWWFADIPRQEEGIARHRSIESPSIAFAPWGKCLTTQLAEALAGDPFAYSPGLDIYDAVDQALAEVVLVARAEARPVRQAVIIIGDSPPPPRDPADPLWDLPGKPVISNARRSPLFRESLADLGALRVPVGWLFVRSPRSPAVTDDLLRPYSWKYPAFQALKQRVLSILASIPGMTLVETSTDDDLSEPLHQLLALLRSREGEIVGLDISLAQEGAR
jgi:hypothetical protein